MSDKPSPGGVERLRALLKRRRELGLEIEGIEKQLPRLKAAKEEADDNYRELLKLIEAMDTVSPGNGGFKGRLVWMLGELDRQAIAEERSSKDNQPSSGVVPAEVIATDNEEGKAQ